MPAWGQGRMKKGREPLVTEYREHLDITSKQLSFDLSVPIKDLKPHKLVKWEKCKRRLSLSEHPLCTALTIFLTDETRRSNLKEEGVTSVHGFSSPWWQVARGRASHLGRLGSRE